jgi:hypothetical protein
MSFSNIPLDVIKRMLINCFDLPDLFIWSFMICKTFNNANFVNGCKLKFKTSDVIKVICTESMMFINFCFEHVLPTTSWIVNYAAVKTGNLDIINLTINNKWPMNRHVAYMIGSLQNRDIIQHFCDRVRLTNEWYYIYIDIIHGLSAILYDSNIDWFIKKYATNV